MIVPMSVLVSYDCENKIAHVHVNSISCADDSADVKALEAVKAVTALMTSGREHWMRTEPGVSVERNFESDTDEHHARARFSVRVGTE